MSASIRDLAYEEVETAESGDTRPMHPGDVCAGTAQEYLDNLALAPEAP